MGMCLAARHCAAVICLLRARAQRDRACACACACVCVPQLLAAHVHAAMVMDEASRVIQGLLPGSQRIARARMASAVLRLALGRRKATR